MLLIPRVFHQIWVGPDPLPSEFLGYQKSWLRRNPGWTLQMWTEDNLPLDLERREIYERLRVPAERADLLRLEVLYRQGGLYIDVDFECLRSVEHLFDGHAFFVASLKPGRTNNALIGSVSGHPLLGRAIKEARPREVYGHEIKTTAGSLFLDGLIKQHAGIEVLPAALFYPATPAERRTAVAIHHAAGTWKDVEALRRTTLAAKRRLEVAQEELFDACSRLERLGRLRDPEAVRQGIQEVRDRIAAYFADPDQKSGEAPSLVGSVRRLGRRVFDRIRYSPIRRVVRKQGQRLRVLTEARIFRRVLRAWNARWRFTYATRLDRIADRDEIPALLNRRRLLGRGVEVGVKKGAYSYHLLRRWRGAQLVSIDPWLEQDPERYVDRANVAQSIQDQYYRSTQARLGVFGARSVIWRLTSAEAAARVPDASLDFVYIDARHDYEAVMEDLTLWFPKVRRGGIVAGHDYFDGVHRGAPFGVKSAVDRFFFARGLPVHTTQGRPPVEMFPSWLVEVPVAALATPAGPDGVDATSMEGRER